MGNHFRPVDLLLDHWRPLTGILYVAGSVSAEGCDHRDDFAFDGACQTTFIESPGPVSFVALHPITATHVETATSVRAASTFIEPPEERVTFRKHTWRRTSARYVRRRRTRRSRLAQLRVRTIPGDSGWRARLFAPRGRSEHDNTSGVLYTESETGQDVSDALRTANKSFHTTRCALWPHPP